MRKSFDQLYLEVFTKKNIEEIRDYIVDKTDYLMKEIGSNKVLLKYKTLINFLVRGITFYRQQIRDLFTYFLARWDDISFSNFIRILIFNLEEFVQVFRTNRIYSSDLDYEQLMTYYRDFINKMIAFVSSSIPPFFAANDKVIETEDEELRNHTINWTVHRLGDLLQKLYNLYYETYSISEDKDESPEEREVNEARRANIIFDLVILNPLSEGEDFNLGYKRINTNIQTPEEFRNFLNQVTQFLNDNIEFIIQDAMFNSELIENIYQEIMEIINSITFI